ncbi:related to TNA1 - high affinity nicotinic acid plasma membrane permease [Melanopsichium pennsylvanicum]|uniref:Related to TNA1 - high affinity nicotinic acid plasma membrane permease n=1 Tax=Melanopsichium pennsylvanicum TaxID=63383 RepID=A0AAJ5C7R7_9BASI|nr:related to TNA1 - high affinity nicotinic acid plasma membrane permease [Melanopsichium pennsylvanicum]
MAANKRDRSVSLLSDEKEPIGYPIQINTLTKDTSATLDVEGNEITEDIDVGFEGAEIKRVRRSIGACSPCSAHYTRSPLSTEPISPLLVLPGIAGIAYFVVIDFPDKAAGRGFLTMAERDMILTRIERDRADSKADALAWAKAARYATDLKAALLIASAPYWTALVAAFCTALVADRYFIRMPILIGQCILTIAGLGMLFVTTNRKVQLAGCFLGVFGTNANIPFVLNFSQNNVPGQAKKSFTSVIVIMFGGIGGIFTSLAYNENDAPLYRKGLYATIACQVFVLLCGIGFTVYFYAANKKIRAGRKVVDDRPGFTYTI